METHPVPQNISSYEFRLVGDMTLKQFLEVAGGVILAVITYRLPLPFFIKYPFVTIFIIIGVMLAFVPINNRPFSQWLLAFTKAIYSPTEFIWFPSSPEAPPAPEVAPQEPTTPAQKPPVVLSFTSLAKSALTPSPTPSATPPPTTAPSATPPTAAPAAAPVPLQPSANQPIFSSAKVSSPPPQIKKFPSTTSSPKPVPLDSSIAPTPSSLPDIPSPPPPAPKTTQPVAPAADASHLLNPPEVPNILTGIVTDAQSKTLEGITIEIIDASTGIPARALRTNRLGQFQIAIPLPPGSYIVNAEKEHYLFDPVSVHVKNTILQPIVITAKAA